MGRRHVRQSNIGRRRPRQLHPIAVDGNGVDLRSVRFEDNSGADVTRVLHAHGIAGIQQQSRDDVQSLLHTRDDRHLL